MLFSFWIKIDDASPTTIGKLEFNGNVTDGSGGSQNHMYINNGNWRVPSANQWYLYVGFVRGVNDSNSYSGSIHTTTGQTGGVGYNDFSFGGGVSSLTFKAETNSTDPNNNVYFFDPRIQIVSNGDDSVSDLLSTGNNTIPVTGVTLDNTPPSLNVNESLLLTATVSTIDATNQGVSWSSSDSSIATVNSSGLVTGIAAGNAAITVTTSDGDYTAQSNITVTDPSGGGDPPPTGGSIWSENNSTASYDGEVAIGRNSVPPGYQLAVEGNIRTREVRVDQENWPDYVFDPSYSLPALAEIKKHIKEKGHLPNIPSAHEVEANGVELGEMNRRLLEKIEELTLHLIQIREEVDTLKQKKTNTN